MVHITSSGYHRTSAMETQCGGYGVLQRCRVVCIEMEMNLTTTDGEEDGEEDGGSASICGEEDGHSGPNSDTNFCSTFLKGNGNVSDSAVNAF